MTFVIAWRTTKLIEGGHRGGQAYIDLYVITSTFLNVFLRFFENPKNVTFYVFCRVSYVFSNYALGLSSTTVPLCPYPTW